MDSWTNYSIRDRNTVEPVLKDHPVGHRNMVSYEKWSVVQLH